MTSLFDVSGKVVLVTGGARGIGRMIADGFAKAGADVHITARKQDVVDAAATEIGAHGIAADLSTREGTDAVIAAITARGGRLDVLVNNAGATWGAPLESYPDEAFDKVFTLNVRAVFRLVAGLAPLLQAAGTEESPSRVINIGSVDGSRVPDYEAYAYGASKAALHMLTRQLAHKLAPRVTVNTVAPGPFPTKMIQHLLADPETKAEIEALVPMRRLGTPEDVAGATIFLSSRAASFITGALVPVDGGITAK
jgi:NAD(P)-dependent dehydrogenase (short-subunit alcohol dehydrogenase family)